MVLDATDPAAIERAACALRDGELVAFPTETVYGLGARADDDAAVAKIYAAKGRPSDHPLLVHVVDAQAARTLAAPLSPDAATLMARAWPGPLSLIVRRLEGVATQAAAGQDTLGLRCPAHPAARALLQRALALGVPGVAAPSANRFGRVSPTTAQHVQEEFGASLLVLDGGPCSLGIESTIVDVSGDKAVVLRPGVTTVTDWLAQTGVDIQAFGSAGALAPKTSGTLASHYAPVHARVRLMDTATLSQALSVLGDDAPPKLAVYSRSVRPRARGVQHRRMPDQPREAAFELFAVLRELDAAGMTLIWVETPPKDPAWQGVLDRLSRAAAAAT
jgi:L-threonylcarbamoyladenylate synthase